MKLINRLMIACLLCIALPASASEVSGLAPDFTLKSRSGENIKLSELRGQVVMINFWASWCGPCRQEMPILDKIYQKYAPLGFTLLGINIEENNTGALQFLKDVEVHFPILWDSKNEISERYNVIAMPSTVMVDRDGNMRYLHKGYVSGTEQEYMKQVRQLVRE